MPYRALDADQIERTIGRLVRRVEQRFAGSGLAAVVRELEGIAHRTSETAAWISRPLVWLRVAIGLLVLLIVAGLGVSLGTLQVRVGPPTLPELVQGIEATINDVVYVAIAVFFLVTIEIRVKRRRALRAIHELRAIAHVIDMHQLTKDPEMVLARGQATGIVAGRAMSLFELSRYLDYCSEALSLTGKVAALYIQRFDDAVALQAVNEVEELTTGLSRKIWQKLTVLYAVPPAEPPERAASVSAAAGPPAASVASPPPAPPPAPLAPVPGRS
jgi:hypothetical protein